MSDTTQKIAEELHESLKYYTDEKQRIFIIQSAIEKATEELANKLQWAKTDSYTEGYNKALGEWLRGEQPSRAAHASDPWKKCKLIDRAAGWAVLCGKDIIIEGLVLEQTNKLIAAHNSTLQPAHASEQGAELFWDDKYIDERLGRDASWPQIIEAANYSIRKAFSQPAHASEQ